MDRSVIMENKNMYTLYMQKKLPKKIQDHIDARVSFSDDENEKLFLAGFMVAKNIYEIKKEMGMED